MAPQPLICCCNTTANKFQGVLPEARPSSIKKCIMNAKKNTVLGKKMAIHGHFWAKTDFFFVLAAPQPLICCCISTANTFQWVLPEARPSSIKKCIMNAKKNTVFGKKLAIHGHFWAKTDFFFVLAARQPPICCSNTTANTFQWVRPRPRRSSMILQNVRATESKDPPMVMKTKDNRNKPHHLEHLSIWFSQSVQHRTKCIMNAKLRHLHSQRYFPAAFTNTAINLNLQALKR